MRCDQGETAKEVLQDNYMFVTWVEIQGTRNLSKTNNTTTGQRTPDYVYVDWEGGVTRASVGWLLILHFVRIVPIQVKRSNWRCLVNDRNYIIASLLSDDEEERGQTIQS